jgi:hypothetical protein
MEAILLLPSLPFFLMLSERTGMIPLGVVYVEAVGGISSQENVNNNAS